ncbi:MAG: thermonuclease family protein [Alphaproteobacteria bacterium]|nr:thermonuclease family protein [Alphaproteobacteria bacterium]
MKRLYAALRDFAAKDKPPRFGDGSTFRTATGSDGKIVLQRRIVVSGPFADGRVFRLAWRTLKACTVAELARTGAFCETLRAKLPGIDDVIRRGGGVVPPRPSLDKSTGLAQPRAMFSLPTLLLAGFIAAVQASSPAFSQTTARPSSSCTVIDGDTISCRDVRIRLVNADAPEFGRRAGCAEERELGAKAKAYVEQRFAQARRISIELNVDRPRDSYGRLLARVRADGRDIGADLIAAGLAKPHTIDGNAVTQWCANAGRRR